MGDSEELEILQWWTCADVPVLKFRENECEKDKIVVEDRSLLRSEGLVVQIPSAEESAEMLRLFSKDVALQMLQAVMDYNSK